MMVKHYSLLKIGGANIDDVIAQIEQMDGVRKVEKITGPSDLMVTVELDDLDAIGTYHFGLTKVPGITEVKSFPVRPG